MSPFGKVRAQSWPPLTQLCCLSWRDSSDFFLSSHIWDGFVSFNVIKGPHSFFLVGDLPAVLPLQRPLSIGSLSFPFPLHHSFPHSAENSRIRGPHGEADGFLEGSGCSAPLTMHRSACPLHPTRPQIHFSCTGLRGGRCSNDSARRSRNRPNLTSLPTGTGRSCRALREGKQRAGGIREGSLAPEYLPRNLTKQRSLEISGEKRKCQLG